MRRPLGSGSDNAQLIGMAAAAGTATGAVRIVYDPATARESSPPTHCLPRPPSPVDATLPHRRRPDHRDRFNDGPMPDCRARVRNSGDPRRQVIAHGSRRLTSG
jgi:hypothetical protein